MIARRRRIEPIVMANFTIREAKARLSKLLARAEAGEKVIIARGRKPVIRLVPLQRARGRPRFGALKGKIDLPDEFFFDPLPEEELRLWEGADDEDL
jgi:prevent-host-death family protein